MTFKKTEELSDSEYLVIKECVEAMEKTIYYKR